MHKRKQWSIMIILFMLVLTACQTQIAPGTTSLSAAARPETVAKTMHPVVVPLIHAPTGVADLEWQNRSLKVTLRLTGLAPKSIHPTHIHTGTCQKGGDILFLLPDVVADAQGQATLETTIKVGHLPTTWMINVHNGPTMTTMAQRLTIACGNITVQANRAHVVLGKTLSPNEAVSGKAELTLEKGILKVKLSLQGLAPRSKHAAHIHMGSCLKPGPVVYPFPPIVADEAGSFSNAEKPFTFPNVAAIPGTGGWYINIHLGTNVGTTTFFNPIACGDVTV